MAKIALILTFVLVIACSIQVNWGLKECPKAYSNCNLGKNGYINVHLVSHTHDDVGWLKTVDQYFYGSNSDKQEATVQYVLDEVVDQLAKDPNKRFVYVEIAYFWRWWNEQSESTQQLVRTLVDDGRLEFVIGAWCMNDEATPYYTDMIDQQTLGFKFILEEFGPCARPRAAWQIDPFGHSREQASLFAQFGFDGLFLGRVDYQDFDNRGSTKTREMLWQGSENLGNEARLFTGVLPNGYGPPPGFCWDTYCGDDPIMDDPNLDEYNVDSKINDFLKYTMNQASQYKTKNLIMTMGSDFQYSNAHRWFKNIDKLIYYVNQRQTTNASMVNIFYSTTACYLYSLNQANTTWPLKYDDFFPYAHRPHSFWTGYFTSRAAIKYNVRKTSSFLQSLRQLLALSVNKDPSVADPLHVLERAMGVVQHHDAVSGTEKQHVANDYAKRMSIGVDKCVNIINTTVNDIVTKMTGRAGDLPIIYCSLLNITECLPIENQNAFNVIVYNPLPREIITWLSVPVIGFNYTVLNLATGDLAFSDATPVYPEIRRIIERKSKADHNLFFQADLPPLGFQVYNVRNNNAGSKRSADGVNPRQKQSLANSAKSNFIIENDYLTLKFDSNGNLMELDNKIESLTTSVTQSFCIYDSMPGDNSDSDHQASGAYIFRPALQTPNCLQVSNYSIFNGQVVVELHQIYNDWISQTIRVFTNSSDVEFEWQVGPIDISDNRGKEVVMRFMSDLKSNSVFYTDSNGREILQRRRDYRPTWKLNQTEPVSGNYYPVNSRIFVRDEVNLQKTRTKSGKLRASQRQLTLVNDRSQGGSSIYDGSVELMLHRRTLYDDSLGVGEPLNETVLNTQGLTVKGSVYLLFSSAEKSASLHRELAHRINNNPLVLFSLEAKSNGGDLKSLSKWNVMDKNLPANLHLLTLTPEYPLNSKRYNQLNSILVRVEHFYEAGEDSDLSLPVTINIQDVFKNTFNFIGIQELALGANMDVDELSQRLTWVSEYDDLENELFSKTSHRGPAKSSAKNIKDQFTFTFNPMQIRTFRLFYLSS